MLVALVLLFTATTATFAADALMGTWKLNESKSKFAPGAAKNTMVAYTPARGDMIKCTVDGVDKDGKPPPLDLGGEIRWPPVRT